MNKNDITIATMTWARDEKEEALLRAALTNLSNLNIPVFVTDGGSNDSFLEFVGSLPQLTLVRNEAKGLVAQVRSSLTAASKSGSQFILYTEPDKSEFFEKHLLNMIEAVPLDSSTGVVTASRSVEGFQTFPEFQRMTETTINNCCNEITGNGIDYTYGPFVLNNKLLPYLDGIKNEVGWGWRPYIFCLAHRLNYATYSYIEDFYCPADQREDTPEERIYRMKQLSQNIEGITLAAATKLA